MQVDCYVARPVDGGKLFEVTQYHNWIRPDNGCRNSFKSAPELLPLAEVVTRFKQAEQAAGLSPTAQAGQSFDAAWQKSLRTSADPAQAIAPTFAPLAHIPLMSDALANYDLMADEIGNLRLLGADGMPATSGNIDDDVLLQAQKAQKLRANRQRLIHTPALPPLAPEAKVGDWIYTSNGSDGVYPPGNQGYWEIVRRDGFQGIQITRNLQTLLIAKPMAIFKMPSFGVIKKTKKLCESELKKFFDNLDSMSEPNRLAKINSMGETGYYHYKYAINAFDKLRIEAAKANPTLPAPERPAVSISSSPASRRGIREVI